MGGGGLSNIGFLYTLPLYPLLTSCFARPPRLSQIKKNTQAVLQSISASKPSEGKGVKSGLGFWKRAFISRTMGGWGGEVEVATIDPASSRYFRGGEEGGKEKDEVKAA